MSKTLTLTPRPIRDDLAAAELWSRCIGAAKLAMRGTGYDHEDRADCAAKLAADAWKVAREADAIVSVLARRTYKTGGDGASGPVIYSQKNAAKSQDDRAGAWVRTDAIRADIAPSFGKLYGQAANYRRGLDRLRIHEAEIAALNAAENFSRSLVIQDIAEPLRSTPDACHEAARDMLGKLGLARLGRAYPMAYRAARASTEAAADDIATELGYASVDTMTRACDRARTRIASVKTHERAAHADALDILSGGIALKPSRSRTEAADHENDWRTKPARVAPVKTRTDKRIIRKHDRKPDWTRDLPKTTDARLAKAAELRRARAAEKRA